MTILPTINQIVGNLLGDRGLAYSKTSILILLRTAQGLGRDY